MSSARLLTWNPHIGRADELRDVLTQLLADTDQPEVVSLQEVWDWGGTVPGYRRVAAPPKEYPHREARSTVLLLRRRRGVRLLGEGFRQVTGPSWVGPNGRVHPPRVFPRMAASIDGWALDTIGVHRTWVNPNPSPHRYTNLRSWQAEHRELVQWSQRRHKRAPGRALVLLGDHNARRTDEGRHGHHTSMAALADDIGGYLALRGIDGAVVREADAYGVDKLDKSYGSDHEPVVLSLRP